MSNLGSQIPWAVIVYLKTYWPFVKPDKLRVDPDTDIVGLLGPETFTQEAVPEVGVFPTRVAVVVPGDKKTSFPPLATVGVGEILKLRLKVLVDPLCNRKLTVTV